jgi:hypothetical protein
MFTPNNEAKRRLNYSIINLGFSQTTNAFDRSTRPILRFGGPCPEHWHAASVLPAAAPE